MPFTSSHSNTAGWRRSSHSQGSHKAAAPFWQLSWGSRIGRSMKTPAGSPLSLLPPLRPFQSPAPGLPNSLGANLCTVLIPGYSQSRLDLTPRATSSKGGAEGLKEGPCPRTPLPSGSASRLPGQGLSWLGHFRGLTELWFPPISYRRRSSRIQWGC